MTIILRCVTAICLVLFSLSALGDDHRKSKGFVMFNAGTLIVGIDQFQFPPNNPPFNPVQISIIEEKTRGTLGRADMKTFAVVTEGPYDPPLEEDTGCPDGFPYLFAKTEDTIVLTFHDLSQLVGKAKGTFICVKNPWPGGMQGVRGEGHWVSGSRRFADVMDGVYYLNATATPQSTNGQYYSTEGWMRGQIKRK